MSHHGPPQKRNTRMPTFKIRTLSASDRRCFKVPSISAPALSFVLVKEKFAKALAKIDASTEVEITPKTATSTSHSPVKADKKQIKPPVFPSVVATALKPEESFGKCTRKDFTTDAISSLHKIHEKEIESLELSSDISTTQAPSLFANGHLVCILEYSQDALAIPTP